MDGKKYDRTKSQLSTLIVRKKKKRKKKNPVPILPRNS